MLTSPFLDSLTLASNLSLPSVKLLLQQEDYATCHVAIPGKAHRVPAIALDGKFYRFSRSAEDAIEVLSLLLKLTARGAQTAMTSTKQGYALWLYEPDAMVPGTIPPTFGPADCWVIRDRQPGYRTCLLKVPDLPEVVPGVADNQKLYSLYRREGAADTALKLSARLAQRGDEVIMRVGTVDYAICIYEPGATIAS